MSITVVIIIISTLISIYGFSNPSFLYKWTFNPYQVENNKEYYRFISSGFIHANWIHLIFNMLVLLSFGQVVEMLYQSAYGEIKGIIAYLLLYFGSMAFSEVATYAKHKDNPSYNSLGASGAVSAVVFASIVFRPLANVYIWGILPLPGIILGIIYLFISARMSKSGEGQINHDAHLYGAIFGFLFTILLKPQLALMFLQKIITAIGL